ncbi:transmembrane protein 106C isoform X2 [Lampris incognitus]|uniref:transmembrane protein 106C isoform X2 n=1 Tax=Lampris incognitus TaxID=2546036 RepID=UPI0024B4EC71|nr:transmembrane protein 106C isoform X2 [Lampris incognitus]
MGNRWSRSGSTLLLLPETQETGQQRGNKDNDDDSLDGLDRQEDIAKFPYVEFTGRDSITCPTCQGTGRIPSEQVNELVALIPYSDQRLQPQRTKLYVVMSAVLCLLASSLVAFFLFPRAVVVVDDGIRSVTVRFDHSNMRVLMNMTSTLNFSNPNFFTVLVQSVSCQVLYMKTVIGTQQLDNVITIQPLSQRQDLGENLLHGANGPEQSRSLSLHRLWHKHHLLEPPASQATLAPHPNPLAGHAFTPPSSTSVTVQGGPMTRARLQSMGFIMSLA